MIGEIGIQKDRDNPWTGVVRVGFMEDVGLELVRDGPGRHSDICLGSN